MRIFNHVHREALRRAASTPPPHSSGARYCARLLPREQVDRRVGARGGVGLRPNSWSQRKSRSRVHSLEVCKRQ